MTMAWLNSPTFDQMRSRAADWWTERSRREQALLAALALTALIALLLVAVVAPLRAVRADAAAKIHGAALLEARLRADRSGSWTKIRRGDARAIVTSSMAEAGLPVQSVTSEGQDVRVVLGNVPFAKVLAWIADLEQSSRLVVTRATIDRTGLPGYVNASVQLSG